MGWAFFNVFFHINFGVFLKLGRKNHTARLRVISKSLSFSFKLFFGSEGSGEKFIFRFSGAFTFRRTEKIRVRKTFFEQRNTEFAFQLFFERISRCQILRCVYVVSLEVFFLGGHHFVQMQPSLRRTLPSTPEPLKHGRKNFFSIAGPCWQTNSSRTRVLL